MDKGSLFFAHGKQVRLSHRLLIYVVLCSAFFTLVATGFQLYWEYARERSAIYDTIQFIQDSYVEPVATSAFMMNEEQTRLQLKGALKLQDIVYLEVSELEDEETVLVIEGDLKARRDIFKEFPLIHEGFSENPFRFGMLRVAASLEGVYQRLWKKIMLILVSNAIKAFLASFCILLIIQLVVTRHLILMAAYARKLNLDKLDRELILNRSISGSSDADELDQVVTAINDMRVRMKADIAGRREAEELLHGAYDELELKIRTRTAELTETNTRLNWEIE
ncbi:MAG: hypothetical protein DRI57_27635 [Deltaproteobacteria bacterium]|nr:MAG: hypothetical protein DRI57_27635 [Deltaproteobacteria bacterium]